MKISGPEYSPKIKYCELCGEKAGLRCLRWENIFYCSADHQTKHWRNHKQLYNLFTECSQLQAKEFSYVHLWTLMQIFSRLPFKKQINWWDLCEHQDCEEEETVFVNDIVTDKMTEFQVGDQVVQINNEKIFFCSSGSQLHQIYQTGQQHDFQNKATQNKQN